MKVKMLMIAAALLMVASVSFGQGFAILVYDDGLALRDQCPLTASNGSVLPTDGQTVLAKIYWDADNNGATANDVQPTVGTAAGNVNFNQFYLDGTLPGLDGGFAFPDYFNSVGIIPANPCYWIAIVYCNPVSGLGDSLVSRVFCAPGVTNDDVDLIDPVADWRCFPKVCTQPCTPTPSWNWTYNGHAPRAGLPMDPIGIKSCVTLCLDHQLTFTITVSMSGGASDPGRIPSLLFTPGCMTCDPVSSCTPGAFTLVHLPGQQYNSVVCNAANCVYTYVLVPTAEGCICVNFDDILAASVNNLAVAPLDNAVNMSWKTASETNVTKYQIVRNGDLVGEVTAAGGATEHNYSFKDESAVNGTTYNYVLRIVNSDNSYNDMVAGSATPGVQFAVVTEYKLHQNYPNPFNPTTSIRFDLVDRNFVTLKIYNATGQEVATVVNGERHAGVNVVNFDATNLTSGLYFYSIKIGSEYSATKKMMLLK